MWTRHLARRAAGPALIAAAVYALSACNLSFSAVARDDWKRSYTLKDGGALEVRNSNGRITVEPGDGNAVEVSAERIVRAATDEAAKDGLSKFSIVEEVRPDRILLDSSGRADVLANMSREVNYTIRVPRSTNVTLKAINGDLAVTGIHGEFTAETTNGRVRTTDLGGSANVTSVNGEILLDFTALGDGGVTCETTNGAITVTLPRTQGARVNANVTNGAVVTEGLDITTSDQSRKRLEGTIAGGGPRIRLTTVNGMVSLKARK